MLRADCLDYKFECLKERLVFLKDEEDIIEAVEGKQRTLGRCLAVGWTCMGGSTQFSSSFQSWYQDSFAGV